MQAQVKIGDRVHVKTRKYGGGRPSDGAPIFGEVVGFTTIGSNPDCLPYSGQFVVVSVPGGIRVQSAVAGEGEFGATYALVPVADWALEVLPLNWRPTWGAPDRPREALQVQCEQVRATGDQLADLLRDIGGVL